MNEIYKTGKTLYGDEFSNSQIEQWFREEEEAYANLGAKDLNTYEYLYHTINIINGFSKIPPPNIFYENVLGIGSAFGDEFIPIIDKIGKLTIVEPSKNLRSSQVGKIIPKYVTPNAFGDLEFENNSFDLITCFGVLHHIPNVTKVLSEMIRVLKVGGVLLIREPIHSMGDWNSPRFGLTKNERGISEEFFNNFF
jgi:SAM-dependent methyltransferase